MARLQQMLDSMKHESFYSCGTYVNEQAGLYVGWACHPGSYCDCMPVRNEKNDLLLFFYGENHADPEDYVRLRQRGHAIKKDDASYVLHLFEESGLDSLQALNGWFSGALVTVARRQVVLFNDRYGLNRIYYHETDDGFYFSSEAKSLLAVLPALRELDPRGAAEWFSCGCALGNRSLFRRVSLLPPGSAWVLSADGSKRKQTYFDASGWEGQPALTGKQFSEQLRQTFPRVLKRYTNGDRPIAMSLTGGLDGRMIMAWTRPNAGTMPCYTFNGSYRDCADVRVARRVAAACGQSHQTLSVGDAFLKQFPQLAEQAVYISDGAMDVTGAAELYVNRLARQIAPVRLTGNYGSEILRRHVAFKPRALRCELFAPEFLQLLAAANRTYLEESAGNRLSFIAFKQVPWHHYARLTVEQSQLALRSPFLDNDLVGLAFRAPTETATSLAPALQLIADGNPVLGRIPTDRGITYPADRMGNRVHRSIQEFLARAEYAYDYGMPDWLAKVDRWLAPFRFERLFLGRQKFYHFRSWYRRELANYLRDILLDARSRRRPYLNTAAVEPMIEAHIRGTLNCTTEIHKILSLELMHRRLLD